MPEIKNTFLKSKMNKDLDSRIIPNGEYRDAQNVNVSKSEGSDVGSLENVLSNELISDIKSLIISIEETKTGARRQDFEASLNSLEVIGKFMDVKNNRIFLMLTNYTDTSPDRLSNFASRDKYTTAFPPVLIYKGACCYIAMYNANSNTSSILVGGNFLNFSKTHKVEGINLLEDLLFFTDNRNQPRKINVRRAINEPFSNTNPYYRNEDHVSVAKFAPVLPISLIQETSSNIWESTMKSKSEQYLPVHLVDTVTGNIGVGGNTINLTRSFTQGSNTSMVFAGSIGVGDKITINNAPNDDLEFTITQYTNGNPTSNSFEFSPATPVIISDKSVVKFQRVNPDYDANYIGDEKVLKDKFQRFSYRFKYDDNEYSLFAPFTQETFIPEQFGYFINDDDQKSGESGVVNFMRNLVDNIKFMIRLPDEAQLLKDNFKVKEIQIVSKASDELAIKVIEDIPVEDLTGSSRDYAYEYNSIKPYKTLPSNEITRVHDKVPVRAKCQEVTGSRVMYGNFLDKHTSPEFLNYQLKTTIKNNLNPDSAGSYNSSVPFSQLKKEYPNHTLKQNRTYTVGVVLVDRYGRSSNVILSKQDVDLPATDKISTIYNNYSNIGTSTIASWPGDVLEIQFNDLIPSSGPNGYPGLYNSSNNPLGWYSYKIVVKQQEQEYYNVYLPGIIAGEIKWLGKLQPDYQNGNIKSTISLYGDNINKVPRDLKEVGSTDIQFRSDTLLFNRVNPNGWDTYTTQPAPATNGSPYSSQSSVGKKPDTVDFIKPFKQFGEWSTSKGNLYPGETNIVFSSGSPPTKNPWYPFTGSPTGSPNDTVFTDPIFRANENPFVAVISSLRQTGVTPIKSSGLNPEYSAEGVNRLGDTSLGVYETSPIFSQLELFYETSTAGLITADSYVSLTNEYSGLNNDIEAGTAGNSPVSFSNINFTLNENEPSGSPATNYFECLDSIGNPCADNSNQLTLTSVTDGFGNDRKKQFVLQQKAAAGNDARFFRIVSDSTFIFNQDASVRENYTFFIEATANNQTNTLSFTGSLLNTAPINISFPQYPPGIANNFVFTSVNQHFDIIEAGYFTNGSAISSRNSEELIFEVDFPTYSGYDLSQYFTFNSLPNGVVRLTYNGGAPNFYGQEFKLRVTDANGNGDKYKNVITGFNFEPFAVTLIT